MRRMRGVGVQWLWTHADDYYIESVNMCWECTFRLVVGFERLCGGGNETLHSKHVAFCILLDGIIIFPLISLMLCRHVILTLCKMWYIVSIHRCCVSDNAKHKNVSFKVCKSNLNSCGVQNGRKRKVKPFKLTFSWVWKVSLYRSIDTFFVYEKFSYSRKQIQVSRDSRLVWWLYSVEKIIANNEEWLITSHSTHTW